MAINFIKKEDLTHITRTTKQWETTVDRYEIIPKGVLCIELCNDKLTKIKIGNGHQIYEKLPYVSGIDLSDYYTKEETDDLLRELKTVKIKGEASSLSDLPLSGNEEGDIYFIPKASPSQNDKYDEYIWFNNNWESWGSSNIDLSDYAKKEYVDQHIQEVQNEITEILESGYLHKHNNKNVLDQTSAVYNTEKDQKLDSLHNYDDTELRAKSHTHLNKNILDQIDAVYNRDKDDKLSLLENYDDTYIQDRLYVLEQVAHFHDNMEVLNRTTAAFTREQAMILLDCKDFEGATATSNGYHGFVPAPMKADREHFLRGDGVWAEVQQGGGDTIAEGGGITITTDSQTGVKTVSVNAGTGLEIDQQTGELNVTSEGTTYTFTSNTDGSFTVTPDGEDPQVVTTYEHPTYTTHQSGLYVITVDETGHISNASAATGNDLPSHEHTVSDITDFPSLGTASSYNVPESGDAGNDEVVLGNDSRLTDARTPVSHTHTESDITDLGPYAQGATHNGAAVSSNKLNIGNSDIGSTTQPVYFDKTSGLPVAIGHTIGTDVPSDAVFTDTTYDDFGGSGNNHSSGLVPDPGSVAGNGRFLCENGTWDTPTDTQYNDFHGSGTGHSHGLVPDPGSEAGTTKYLREDGQWYVPPDTIYEHPTYTPHNAGLYVITVDETGHISNASSATAADLPSHTHSYAGSNEAGGAATSANKLNIGDSDIGSLTHPVYFDKTTGLPVATTYELKKTVPEDAVFTDTTYDDFVGSGNNHAHGLVPDPGSEAGTSKYLCENGSWAVPPGTYSHPTHTPAVSGLYKVTVDALGHVSATESVQGSDLPSHEHTVSDITDFPTLGTASSYDVPESGDAGNDEVVLGNDSRLTDARTPTAHEHTISDITDFGTYADGDNDGAALSANMLNIGESDVGSSTQPVYFDSTTGLPVAIDYTIETSVPENAVFTDTTYNDFGGSGNNHSNGLVPDPGSTAGTSRFLREDGGWEEPPSYELPIAGPAILGGIKIGDGIDINNNGVASVNKMDPFRVGRGLTMEDESVRLPTGYYKAKYVESDGYAYTTIPFTPASYPNAEVIGRAMVTGVRPQYNQGFLFGVTSSNNWTGHFNFVLSTKTTSADSAVVSKFYYGNEYAPSDNPPIETGYAIGDILDFEMSASDGLKINNETIHSITSSMSGLSTPYAFAIFGLSSGMNIDYMSKARIYSLKIYNGDTLLHNLVPAYRQSDEKVGFYNTVNSTFYTSANSSHPFTTDLTDLDPGDPDWVLKANIATTSSIGEVIVGNGLSVAADGTVSAKPMGASGTNHSAGMVPDPGSTQGSSKFLCENGTWAEPSIEYNAGNAIDIDDLVPTLYSSNAFIHSINTVINGSFLKNNDETEITITATDDDCYTEDLVGQINGSYPFAVDASTKYRLTWTIDDDTVSGEVKIFENGLSTIVHTVDQSEATYLEFTTDENTTFITTRFGITNSGDSYTLSNVNLHRCSTNAISVKYGDGLQVNQNNQLEVSIAEGLVFNNDDQLKVKLGAGLHFNDNNAVEMDSIDIDSYEAGNGISFAHHYVRELPSGYTQLDYIESHFDAGFILDYYPQKTSKIVCEVAYVDYDGTSPTNNCLFGTRNGSSASNKQYVLWFSNTTAEPGTVTYVYSGKSYSQYGKHNTNVGMNTKLSLEVSPADGVYCNGIKIQDTVPYPNYDSSPYKLGIFCLANSDTTIETPRSYQSGRIYTFKIYESDTLVVDLVPCLDANNVPGLYDMVNEVFYSSASGTDFTYDPDAVITHDSISIDVNPGDGIIFNRNTVSLNPGQGLSIDNLQALNVNIADGLSIKNTTTNAIKVNTGTGLSVDSTTNNLNVNIGDGLVTDASNNIDVNVYDQDLFIKSDNNQIRINPFYAPTYEAGNGVQFVSTDPSALPTGYTRLTYIESGSSNTTRAAAILDYVPTKDTVIDVTFEFIKNLGNVAFIGVQDGAGTSTYAHFNLEIAFSTSSNKGTIKLLYGKNGNQSTTQFNTNLFTPIHVVASKDGVFVDDVQVQTVVTTDETMPQYKMRIFSIGSGNNTGFSSAIPVRMYDFKLYEGSVLSAHMIPCLNPNNVPGVYDIVNNVFYNSTWAADFTYDSNDRTRPGYYVQAKLGNGLAFDANGAIQATGASLPPATTSSLGGVIIGDGLKVDNQGTVELDDTITIEIHGKIY